jgi:hypothetical protein
MSTSGLLFQYQHLIKMNNGKERKSFFNAINDTLFKYTDDSDKNYNLILGDFNCAIQKNFQSVLHRNGK